MPLYRVRHRESGATFFLEASSPHEAIEIVTMRVGNVEGVGAWEAKAQEASFDLSRGKVYDADGNVVPDVML